MNKYPELTREQKTRKQAIRNWKRAQRELVEYCIFADICEHVYNKDKKDRALLSLSSTDRVNLRKDAKNRIYKNPANELVDIEMKDTRDNLKYSLKDIFQYHDKQDAYNYKNELLVESVVDFLYK